MDVNIPNNEIDNTVVSNEVKPEMDVNNRICRCCLSTERRMAKINNFRYLFMDLADIIVTDSDGLPQWICWECAALLRKCVRFKQKVLKAHTVLYDYHGRCVPFAIDGQDPELTKFSTPHLKTTKTLYFDTVKSKPGFHSVLQHEKITNDSPLLHLEIPQLTNCEQMNDVFVKSEDLMNDGYDLVPVDDFVSSETEDTDNKEYKQERKRKVKGKIKIENDKSDDVDINEKPKRRTRTAKLDIDETKIRIIKLDPIEQLKERERECKAQTLPFHCKLCYQGFSFESKLQNHMKKHSPSRGPYKCTLCSTHLPTNYSLSVHSLVHTRRFECLKCGRRMLDKDSIVNHYRTEHEGITSVFTCHVCGKIFNNHKTLRGHIRNHHSGGRAKCDQCGKTFINKDALEEHQLIHEGVKNHECPVCHKRFRTRHQVRNHQTKHSDRKDFYCVECDVRFKTSHALRQHLRKSVKHKDMDSLEHQCPCGKRFSTAAQLTHHRAVQHEGVRAHACPSCPAALATRSSLLKHVRAVHKGHRAPPRHVCDTCGRLFRARSTLTNHARTHTGEKPFACTDCGRAFSQRTALRTHTQLVHLKLPRGKTKTKPPADATKFKEEPPIVFEWTRQGQSFEYFTVTAGP
ncbi:zinc finger protein 37-like [Colias croceus]|uniref:zinc finger protein 37-like n=1 Tax=Colias crocea TaxID=72248 RepID=UPI001E27C7D2|nr:zinc finger protein 37-like [Colias croceus]